MGLFKEVKRPVIRSSVAGLRVSEKRPRFEEKAAPCSERCPAGTDVRGWLNVIGQAEAYNLDLADAFEKAWRIIVESNPFPATLSRICPHPCESACTRRSKDGAVSINVLEGYVGDAAIRRGLALERLAGEERTGRVAIVGAGPAGLSCACRLARLGYRTTVFEARDLPGGRLRDATRTARLRAETLDAEIARIVALGVEVRCSVPVDSTELDTLAGDWDAVFVATGRVREGAAARSIVAECPGGAAGGGEAGFVRMDNAPKVFIGGDAVRHGLVPAALLHGRAAAAAIDCFLCGMPAPAEAGPRKVADRVLAGWFKDAQRREWVSIPEPGGDDPAAGEALDLEIGAEAARCMSCGLCMDCETCWMYCTERAFERLPKGQHYRLNLDVCNGCGKCADVCPCGYIDMI